LTSLKTANLCAWFKRYKYLHLRLSLLVWFHAENFRKKMRKEWDKTLLTHTGRVLAAHLPVHVEGYK